MIGTLLRRQLHHNRYLILALVAGMVGFELLIVNIGAAMDQGPGLQDILESLPAFLKDLIRTQIGDISFPAFAAFGFEHPATMGSALAYVVFVTTNPAAEREQGILDLILARPLTRSAYLTATLLHLVAIAVVLPVCLLTGTGIALWMVESEKELSWTAYIPAAIGLSSLLLAWGGVGLYLSTLADRRGTAVAQMIAAILTFFLLDVLAAFSTSLSLVQWVSPFHYFDPTAVVLRSDPYGLPTAVLCGVFALTTAAAFAQFERRDL